MSFLLLSFRNQWRQKLPGKFAMLGFSIGLLLELLIYWYTSKAFSGNFIREFGVSDYFSYIVLGELVLMLPAALVASAAMSLSEAQGNGTLEPLFLIPNRTSSLVLKLAVSAVFFPVLHLLLMVLGAVAFFGFRLPAGSLPLILLLQVASIPCFAAIGLCVAAIFLRYQRGLGAIGFISRAAAVLAGVYFPVAVLPEWLRASILVFSPFSAVLEASRKLLVENSGFPRAEILCLLAWTCFCGLVAAPLLEWARESVRRRGSLEVIPDL